MHILVVEDDRRGREFICRGLRETGYSVDCAADGANAIYQSGIERYDLVVLDVMRPGLDGWTVIQRLRSRGQTMPVLFLTARNSVADRVKGRELGADDYLVKPFASKLIHTLRGLGYVLELRDGN